MLRAIIFLSLFPHFTRDKQYNITSCPLIKKSRPAPAQNETTSTGGSPLGSLTNKPEETNDAKTLKQDSADPNIKEISPAETETIPKDALSLRTTPPINNSKTTEDAEALKQGPADHHMLEKTPSEHQTTQPRLTLTTATTNEKETDGMKAAQPDSAAGADSHVQEITPVENETASTHSSPPENCRTQIAAIRKPETDDSDSYKKDSATDADSFLKKILSTKWKTPTLFRKKGKILQSKSSVASQGTEAEATAGSPGEKQLLSKLMKEDVAHIVTRAKDLGQYKDQLHLACLEASKKIEEVEKDGDIEDFRELRKYMMKLKLQLPSIDAEKDPHKNLRIGSKAKQSISEGVLPLLHKRDAFERSIEFKDFEARYSELPCHLKLCLLCLSVFPENAIIKKRLMVHWWVAEGFASEDEANKCFAQLIEKGFIEAVNKNRRLSVGSYKMHPFNRSALVMLAERAKFFRFGDGGEPTQNFSESFQACLVGEGLISYEDLKEKKLKVDDLEKLHLLINLNEHILEFKPDWFSKMRNLNFLYLGRWKVLATDHIEVEDTKFLDGLENMSCVKFLSLQGVSNIIALPESILKLKNLSILDIRACYNLESIPEGIGLLKRLTHLDMSECYLLDHMPKSLPSLKELKVLKGFVVGAEEGKGRCCTLDDLTALEHLEKLCIYTDRVEFPGKQHVTALEKLKKLRKLTITWGERALRAKTDKESDNGNEKDTPTAENKKDNPKKQEPQATFESSNGLASEGRLPQMLEKLDLECCPMSTTPNWLALNNLKRLKKLYIRGGKLSDLGQYQDIDDCSPVRTVKKETWNVEVLRLKYLSEIDVEWGQLHELFPNLVYLEQVSCPKLTLFPCDANGVWINKIKLKASSGIVL